eukprot:1616577-Pyramimonas_sp.AAC.2
MDAVEADGRRRLSTGKSDVRRGGCGWLLRQTRVGGGHAQKALDEEEATKEAERQRCALGPDTDTVESTLLRPY